MFFQGNQNNINIKGVRKFFFSDAEIFTWSVLQSLMIVYFGINLYDLHLDKKDVVYISVDDYSTLIKSIRNLMLLEVHHMQLSNYFKTSLRAYTDKLCLSAVLSFDVHQVHMPNIFKSIIKLHVYNRWYIHSLVFISWK